jgi:hypothetical protein
MLRRRWPLRLQGQPWQNLLLLWRQLRQNLLLRWRIQRQPRKNLLLQWRF